MQTKFTKMHGLGNDFAVFDCRKSKFEFSLEQIRHLADRQFGIGFDQLLVIEHPKNTESDFAFRIFNADGSEVECCGNGARCFAKYLRDSHSFSFERPVKVATQNGILEIDYIGLSAQKEDLFRVDMGIPDFSPFTDWQTSALYETIEFPELGPIEFGIVSIGNPHAVCEVSDISKAPVEIVGKSLQTHPLFPQRVNVGFMQILDRRNIYLRVYGRGTGETLACGTGASAAVAVGISRGLLDQCVTVQLSGGTLLIEWSGDEYSNLKMSGSAMSVYKAELII